MRRMRSLRAAHRGGHRCGRSGPDRGLGCPRSGRHSTSRPCLRPPTHLTAHRHQVLRRRHQADIKTIQGRGGDVIASFGGCTADTTGAEIAGSCTDVDQIAAVHQKVITTYDIPRLNMDIEVDALDNTAGIDRRNKAIETVQDWAAATGREPEISYTLPTTTKGLAASGLALLRNAMANGARADVANIMTLDYYDNALHDMAQDTTKTVAQGLYDRLARRCPSKTPDQLWGVIGITEMPGVDDFGWPRRDFSLTASPATATLKAGGSTTSTVQTSATAGTARTVTLTASGAPAGVTASLIPPQ